MKLSVTVLLAALMQMLVFTTVLSANEQQRDSLINELLMPHHDSIRFELLLAIGDTYYFSKPDTAVAYFLAAKELAEKNLKKKGQYHTTFLRKKAKAIHYIAYVYFYKGDYVKAMELYFNVLEIGMSINCDRIIYNCYNNIGMINHERKEYDVAEDYYEMALEITERTNNKMGMVKLYNNLGVLNYDMGSEIDNEANKQKHFDIAHIYFLKTLDLRKELNDLWGMALCYNNMANLARDKAMLKSNTLQKEERISEAIKYYRKTTDIAYQIDDKMSLSKAYSNLSELYLLIHDFDSTIEVDKKKLADSAVHYATLSYRYADDLNSIPRKNQAALTAKKAYTEIGNLEAALLYADLYIETSTQLFNQNKTESLDEMRVRFETEQKENEILILSKEREIQEISIKKSQKEKVFFIFIIITFVLFSTMLLKLYRNKKKTGIVLEEINTELNQLNSMKDKFISILAHDLKNPLTAFTNITSALHANFELIDNTEKKRLLSNLHSSSVRLNRLLNNMLKWAVAQRRGNLQLAELNLLQVFENITDALTDCAKEHKVNIINTLQKDLIITSNKTYINIILNNLVSNAVKFSEMGAQVYLSVRKKQKTIEITVEDFGIGISEEDIQKLFRIDIDARTIGKSIHKGTGMGLILCKELLEKIEGSIRVESKINEGSKFILSLPYSLKNQNASK